MLPPAYQLSWSRNDTLPEHQLLYLAASEQADKETVKEKLEQFGEKFKSKVEKEPFTWNGIATIKKENGSFDIENQLLKMEGLASVSAHRVIRENVEHSMLVGDRQMTSHQLAQRISVGKKRPYIVLVGWILFVLALIAIVFLLYKNGFNPLSSGLQMKAS